MKIASFVAAAALVATGARGDNAPEAVVAAGLTAIFVDFDVDAARALLAEDYIQHNPDVPTGAAPILGFIPALKESGLKLTAVRVIAEGDLVVTHTLYENAQAFGGDTLVGFDVFRVKDGKLAEHWDNLVPQAAPNPSGRTQLDGATAITDRGKTADNKALVTTFIETVLMRGEADRITDFISSDSYLQHNSAIADGLDGLGAALAAMARNGVAMVYSDLHMVVAEGAFVFTAAEGTFGGAPTAFFDLFRVEDGRIVEHWDAIAAIPAEMAHANGKF